MNTQIILWSAVAMAAVAVILFKLLATLNNRASHAAHSHSAVTSPMHHRRFKLIEVGKEWEEFYVPGDRIIKDEYDATDEL